jgi:tripartite-type tricarboxylate transporter receptor subunit TctC
MIGNRGCTVPKLVEKIFACAVMALSAQAYAQSFPVKPVRLIIPFPPGGAADAIARIVSAPLAAAWKQPVLVENKSGAGSTIAAAFVASAPPDGYTLYINGVGVHATSAALYKNLSYHPVKSFTAVSKVSMSPFIFVVNPAVKATTMKELVALGRAKPEALSYASSGSGATPHLMSEMLAQATGTKFLHVPFKGTAPAMVALLAGQVDFQVADVSAMPQVRAGKLRALAVTSQKRSALVPGVPTMAESGVPDFVVPSIFAILGPAGIPRDLVAFMNVQINRSLATDEMRRLLANQGFEPDGGTPEELVEYLNLEVNRYARVVREVGVKLD